MVKGTYCEQYTTEIWSVYRPPSLETFCQTTHKSLEISANPSVVENMKAIEDSYHEVVLEGSHPFTESNQGSYCIFM